MNDKSKLTMWSILLLLFLFLCSWYHSYKVSIKTDIKKAQISTQDKKIQSNNLEYLPIAFDVIKRDQKVEIGGRFYDEAQMRSFGENFTQSGDIHYIGSFDKKRRANEALALARDLAPIFNRDFIEGSIRYRGRAVFVSGVIKNKDSFEMVKKILKEHQIESINNTKLLQKSFEAIYIQKSPTNYQLDANVSSDAKKSNLNIFGPKISNIFVDNNLANSKCFETVLKLAPIFNKEFESGLIDCKDNKIKVEGTLKNQEARKEIEKILKDSKMEFYLNLTKTKDSAHRDFLKTLTPQQQKLVKEVENSINSILKMHKITFKTGSSKLTKEGKSVVKEVAKILKKYPNIYIEIAGHTDDIGDDRANLTLSQKRVQRVKDELVASGIDAERLNAVGYGESRPLVPNDSKEHRSQNRRVEFHIIKIKE